MYNISMLSAWFCVLGYISKSKIETSSYQGTWTVIILVLVVFYEQAEMLLIDLYLI